MFYKIKKKLPNYIFSFPIKKYEILKAIIKNKKNIKKINEVIHPEIRIKIKKFLKINKKKKIVILDIPLLLENRINKKKDIIIFVFADKKQILKRLKKRPNFNSKIYDKLKKLQLPIEVKRKKSNFIIKNNFKPNYVKKNVNIILNKL